MVSFRSTEIGQNIWFVAIKVCKIGLLYILFINIWGSNKRTLIKPVSNHSFLDIEYV